jgi:hypothetical protein
VRIGSRACFLVSALLVPAVWAVLALADVARAEPALCGDVDGDSFVALPDVARLRAALAGSGAPLSIDEELRCNVKIDSSLPGGSTVSHAFDDDCTILDVAIVRRALAGAWPEPQAVCPGGSSGDCCVAGSGPGCNSPELVACVCATLPECCAAQWTTACAAAATAETCGGSSPGAAVCDADGGTPATQTWLADSVFKSTGTDWWSGAMNRRIFVGDADGDARADLVGIASNGDVWVAVSTGTSFAPAAVWAAATVFSAANGWFDATYWDRIWLADVTGDGTLDLVGVANNGDLWIAESTGSAFAPTHLVASSAFATPAYFERAHQNRVFVGDVNGDGKADVVGIGAAASISVSLATGSGTSAAFAASTVWRTASIFNQASDWFNLSSQARVWLADVTGDGASDVVGIANNGDIWVSEAVPAASSFAASHIAGASHLRTTGDPATNFFATGTRSRIWLADVTGDGKVDIVAIAPPDVGDGDVWIERAAASVGVASFTERVALRDSVYKTGNGWFDLAHQPRVFVTDVTGDGRADLSGIANNGDVWVARSAAEVASSTAPAAARGTRDFFQPSERVGPSIYADAGGFLSAAGQAHVFEADVTGDGVSDLVGISPGSLASADGNVHWRMALPATVRSMTEISPEMLDAGAPRSVTLEFSRALDPGTLSASSLRVHENGVRLTPLDVSVSSRSATWTVAFTPAGGAPTNLDVELSTQTADRWGGRIDGDGDGFAGGSFARSHRWHPSLLVGEATADLTSYPLMAGLPAPSGYGYCPAGIDTTLPRGNPPNARVLVLAAGGSCAADLDCRGAQTCVASWCREPDGTGADRPFVLVSVDQVGFNPGRARDLIEARTGIPRERIAIAATHAHWTVRNIRLFTAPYDDDRYSNSSDLPYQSWIEDRIADTVQDALHGMLPTQIDVTFGTLALGFNRRGSSVMPDHETRVVRFRVAGGRVRAAIVNHAVHPVSVDSGDGLDADFPGYLAQAYETLNCPTGGCTALFVNGGAGDIDPLVKSVAYAQSMGSQLAGLAFLTSGAYQSTTGMQIAVEREIRGFAQGISSCHNCPSEPLHDDGEPVTWDAEATAVRIGVPGAASPALVFGTLPGEPFTQLQRRLRTNATPALLFGYTDGYLGYLPDDSAYGDGHGLYGVAPCADSSGSYQNGPSYFSNVPPTPGETLVDDLLDAIDNRLGN